MFIVVIECNANAIGKIWQDSVGEGNGQVARRHDTFPRATSAAARRNSAVLEEAIMSGGYPRVRQTQSQAARREMDTAQCGVAWRGNDASDQGGPQETTVRPCLVRLGWGRAHRQRRLTSKRDTNRFAAMVLRNVLASLTARGLGMNTMSTPENCANCRYSRRHLVGGLHCHRGPPMTVVIPSPGSLPLLSPGNVETGWSKVHASDWCGEWRTGPQTTDEIPWHQQP